MVNNWKRGCLSLMAVAIFSSCGNNATQSDTSIEASNAAKELFSTTGSTTSSHESTSELGEGHVTVIEILHASRYDYLKVSEAEGKEYWIATRSGDFKVGAEYHYHEGLYKTDYYSTEFDRTFDKIYLVSKIHPVNEGETHTSELPANHPPIASQKNELQRPEGSVFISDIVKNSEQYNNRVVQVTGMVVKVNPHIMNRNWIHLQDGSMDGYDFVLTSEVDIPAGHAITLKGTVHLNRDFGAGYVYDLIVEDAQVVR